MAGEEAVHVRGAGAEAGEAGGDAVYLDHFEGRLAGGVVLVDEVVCADDGEVYGGGLDGGFRKEGE